jgi:hypothetical protein
VIEAVGGETKAQRGDVRETWRSQNASVKKLLIEVTSSGT